MTPGLTVPQVKLLWRVAQHKYGWAHVYRGFSCNETRTAEVLIRRGLVRWGDNGRDCTDPHIVATDSGRAEILEHWPVSPFALGTYEEQPGGWMLWDGVRHPSERVAA